MWRSQKFLYHDWITIFKSWFWTLLKLGAVVKQWYFPFKSNHSRCNWLDLKKNTDLMSRTAFRVIISLKSCSLIYNLVFEFSLIFVQKANEDMCQNFYLWSTFQALLNAMLAEDEFLEFQTGTDILRICVCQGIF